MQKFQEWFENRHEYAKEWKQRTGGKVIGYFCTYVPEEILYAAGVLPVRILGSHEPQDVTEPHIFGMFCPFCRDCLAQGLKGRFDYLDGITIAQSCLHIRQAYTSWDLHRPREFSYYLPMPHHVQSKRAYPFLRSELAAFKEAVEKWTGKTISDADLDRGIEIMNTSRRLMREVYELRKRENPPLTGLEAMYLVLSGQMVDKREHNAYLEQKLKELSERQPDRQTGERLMILGSEDDDTAFMAMAESLGTTFVVDDHCTGSRYFWNRVEPQEDRLMAIAARYIDRPACPTKDWPERSRLPHILKLAKEWNVQGAIVMQQKFCDPHELDIPAIRKYLEENGVPTLFLEFDVTVPIGQFRIRVEAFLEMLRQEDLF
ncbi:benzoyl-CoA reductase, bzd-type, subunit N [Desulfotomaculum copahuensis]|uniref:Benzoyl-CoA reductase, bzd-type, subunit N n=1 Tax=Desulfotomaculum copahuensis TaxID=1838280 RepID=A0A1B7LGS5_9FIRM|nr:benzoyl-CoA reductase, bzd-type, subunit N [Desulfotomaculum copahuensis]OAT85270.1 benzoyl-CoA reductase, bzd-type, subunit N [Desulfotomaculum copahuensis]